MTGCGETSAPRHLPVMLSEVLGTLAPAAGETYIDGTFGAGGYSTAILRAADCRVLALDRDPTAVAAARPIIAEAAGRLTVVESAFGRLDEVARTHVPECGGQVDGVVLDIGVSSMQLDTPERGFSFQADGPLDMRMGGDGPTAADVIGEADEMLLADILFHLGEERQARRIARAIVRAREEAPIETTRALVRIVERAIGAGRREDKHPATRTFQALRIHVNDELGELRRALTASERCLKPGGRLVVVTFHSLEDRVVKRFLALRSGKIGGGSRHGPPVAAGASPSFQIINQRPLTPSQPELAANPRARSAKLRAARRTEAPPAKAVSAEDLGIPVPGGDLRPR